MDQTNLNTALASAVCEELARAGVRRAVISPGSRSTPVALALHREAGIETSVVTDERSAGFLALGASATGRRPVVLLCTSGTAAANYHPAVSEADLSSLPLIVITADRPPELRDVGAGQTIDQIKLFGSAVRWFCEIGTHVADDEGLIHLRSLTCRAVAVSRGDPRPGPVHLNFPLREPLVPVPGREGVTATSRLALYGRDPEPLTSIEHGSRRASPESVAGLADEISATSRGLIAIGRQTDPDLREPVAELARRSGYPILAEPTSQLRLGPHDRSRVCWRYDSVLRDPAAAEALVPDLVLRFGELPTSKSLRGWLSDIDRCRQIVVDGSYAWTDSTRVADRVIRADPVALATDLSAALDPVSDAGFAEAWLEADRRHAGSLGRPVAGEPLTAAAIHGALAECYRDRDLVYTASSLPIREQEWHLPPAEADVTFLANRGANGIDGLISSGIGACLESGRPTLVITGDVGLLHDLGALASWRLATAPFRLLVINNGGGRIFDLLPQRRALEAHEFGELMTTPTGIELEQVAKLFGLPYRSLTSTEDLGPALDSGPALIEARVPPPTPAEG